MNLMNQLKNEVHVEPEVDIEAMVNERMEEAEADIRERMKSAEEDREKMISEAYDEAEKIRTEAQDEGYNAGHTQGFKRDEP